MRLLTLLLLGQAAYTEAHKCGSLTGPFENDCTNIKIEYCNNRAHTSAPCLVTVGCATSTGSLRQVVNNVLYLPESVSFEDVKQANGTLSHPALDRLAIKKGELSNCNPCFYPDGSYNKTCKETTLTYSFDTCYFKAKCHDGRKKHLPSSGEYPPNILITNVTNELGTLTSSDQQFKGICASSNDAHKTGAGTLAAALGFVSTLSLVMS